VSSALDANEKTIIEDAVQKAIAWLDSNQDAGKVEYETKLKELEAIWCPILRRTYQGGEAGEGMPDLGGSGSHSHSDDQGPRIQEVD
jgi:L1 cell adhesion molecule like protein